MTVRSISGAPDDGAADGRADRHQRDVGGLDADSRRLVGDATPDAPTRQGIQSVEIAARVLRAVEDGSGPMTLGQVAAGSAMAPSKVHRYLVSLGRAGLVTRSAGSGRYDLGPAARRLGIEALRRTDEVSVATEHAQALRDRTSHAVNLAVWGDHGPVLIRWDYGSWALPITVRVGATLPLLTSSVGRAYLAQLPEAMTAPVLAEQHADLQRDADRQHGGGRLPASLAAQVRAVRASVRRDGYALTTGGVVPGITSVAAAVPGSPDSLPVVVALVLPARQATDATVAAMARELLATVAAASDELGHARQEGSRRA